MKLRRLLYDLGGIVSPVATSLSGLVLESLTLSAKGNTQSMDFETSAKGEAQSPFDALVRGAVSRTGEEDRVVLSALEGRYDAYPIPHESLQKRGNNVSAALSGSLNLVGSTRKASVGGELVVGPVEVDIGRRMAPSVTRLNVIEIHGDPEDTDQPETGEAAAPTAIDLDIAVRIPNRVFVRGSGLNSEWKGNLKVRGAASEPSIVGNLEIVPEHSNYLDFLDKRFHITRGIISFDGGYPPSPMLDITTETQGKDITGYLLVTGFADSPKIELASDPPVPQDEILSRILFGRSLSQITPMQAVKLAQAMRSLTSGNGKPGIMDRTRTLLGLDQLEIREGMGEGSSAGIGFGKYLREDIYLDVQRDLQGQAGRAMVEVEITPNITVHGEAGSDASTGLGINWKYDY